MLMCGIIDELEHELGSNANISFFFCQATDERINNAASVLRGLIYLITEKQPSLFSHVQKRYDRSGKQLFKNANAWQSLTGILSDILRDPSLHRTYFLIDALDEYLQTAKNLAISQPSSETYTHSTWGKLISSFRHENHGLPSLSWSANGKLASASKSIKIWSPIESSFDSINGHSSMIETLNWSPDGEWLISRATDGKIQVWEPVNEHELASTLVQVSGNDVACLSWSYDGSKLALGKYAICISGIAYLEVPKSSKDILIVSDQLPGRAMEK
jgi:WD40 repeat protein